MDAKRELVKLIRDEWNLFPKAEVIVSCGIKFNIIELAQAILDAGFVKIKPFEWMEQWLKAYDKEHKTNLAKEVLDWINQQPMGAG